MDSLIDYTQSPQEILTAIINQQRGTEFSPAQLVFGLPVAVSENFNTQIQVTGATGVILEPFVFSYNRVALATIPGTRTRIFTAASAVTLSALLPAINAVYQINLTAADIVDGFLPIFTDFTPGDTKPFTIAATTSSLIYQGSVNLNVRRFDVDLSSVIAAVDLD